MTPSPLGLEESESRLTQEEVDSTGEGSLDGGISTGNLVDWPRINRKESLGTFAGAPAAAGSEERLDVSGADPVAPTLIPWQSGGG